MGSRPRKVGVWVGAVVREAAAPHPLTRLGARMPLRRDRAGPRPDREGLNNQMPARGAPLTANAIVSCLLPFLDPLVDQALALRERSLGRGADRHRLHQGLL